MVIASADPVRQGLALLLVTLGYEVQYFRLLLKESFAEVAGLIERQSFGNGLQCRFEIIFPNVDRAQVIARPHVIGIDPNGSEKRTASVVYPAQHEETVPEGIPKV